jgi:hypothetical protein
MRKKMKCDEYCELEEHICISKSCRYYITSEQDFNCCLISARKGPQSLREISNKIGISYVSVHQLEEKILSKLKKRKLLD